MESLPFFLRIRKHVILILTDISFTDKLEEASSEIAITK